MTYCFDATGWTDPARVTVCFDGRLLEEEVAADAQRTFTVTDTAEIPPRAGRVTLTARAPKLSGGQWRVSAVATVETRAADGEPARLWRLPSVTADGTTGFEPVMRVRAPGARLGVWPALVFTGALLAYATQLLVAPRLHVPAWRLVVVSILGSLIGLVTAKVTTGCCTRRRPERWQAPGLGIQGFVLGALTVLLIGAALTDLPLLRSLDTITPGLLLGMTIGRLGCFFGGCCAGLPPAAAGCGLRTAGSASVGSRFNCSSPGPRASCSSPRCWWTCSSPRPRVRCSSAGSPPTPSVGNYCSRSVTSSVRPATDDS